MCCSSIFSRVMGSPMRGDVSSGAMVSGRTLDPDALGAGEDGGPLDDVAQFADIARPGIGGQRPDGLVRESGKGPVVVPAVEDQEPFRERLDVVGSFAEGGIAIWKTLSR